jgi:hypothetical protein
MQHEADVIIFQNIIAEKMGGKLAILTQITATQSEKWMMTLVCKKSPIFCRKLVKFGKKCDHIIGSQCEACVQGDQIGRIFACWAIVYDRQHFNSL